MNTQTTGTGTSTSPFRIGTSTGFNSDQVKSKFYAPQVIKNYSGWNSYLAIQNADPTTAATVNISYKDRFGTSYPSANQQFVIQPNTNKVVYLNENSNLPASNFQGSAVVEATSTSAKLAMVVNFYNSGSGASTSQFHSYNGFTGGSAKVFLPRVVRNYYNYNSGVTVQNVGTGDATYKINFYFPGSTDPYVYNSGTVAGGASEILYLPDVDALDPVDALPGNMRYGYAVVVSTDGTFVAIVNEDNRGGAGVPVERAGQGSSYNGVLDGTQSNKVIFPQIPRNKSNFSGQFVVSNTTSNAGTCDIVFSGVPAATLNDVELPANGTISRYLPNIANLPNGFNQGVTATCTQPVVGIFNLSINLNTGLRGDSFTQSTGLNQ